MSSELESRIPAPPRASADSGFRRTRHLLFACLGLLHAPLTMRMWEVLHPWIGTYPWSARIDALANLVLLCFAAAIAWLAFEAFDTRSGVTVLPRRWADVGILVLAAFVISRIVNASLLSRVAPEKIDELMALWLAPYTAIDGGLMVGWLALATVAGVLAEELVYRALLLRALEGFVNRWVALVLQAVVFELVHVFVYERGFQGGGWFVAGVIYGYAFQRTRSVAVPAVLHAVANLVFFLEVWWLGRG